MDNNNNNNLIHFVDKEDKAPYFFTDEEYKGLMATNIIACCLSIIATILVIIIHFILSWYDNFKFSHHHRHYLRYNGYTNSNNYNNKSKRKRSLGRQKSMNRISIRLMVIACISYLIFNVTQLSTFGIHEFSEACHAVMFLGIVFDVVGSMCLSLIGINLVLIFVVALKVPQRLEKYYYISLSIIACLVIIPVATHISYTNDSDDDACWFYYYFEARNRFHFIWLYYYSWLLLSALIAIISALIALHKVIKEKNNLIPTIDPSFQHKDKQSHGPALVSNFSTSMQHHFKNKSFKSLLSNSSSHHEQQYIHPSDNGNNIDVVKYPDPIAIPPPRHNSIFSDIEIDKYINQELPPQTELAEDDEDHIREKQKGFHYHKNMILKKLKNKDQSKKSIFGKVAKRCMIYTLIPVLCKSWGIGIEIGIAEYSDINYPILVVDRFMCSIAGFLLSILYFTDPTVKGVWNEMVSDFKKQYVDNFYYVNISQLNRFMDSDEHNETPSPSSYNNICNNNNNCNISNNNTYCNNSNSNNNNCNNNCNNKEALLSNYFIILPARDKKKKKKKPLSTSGRAPSIISIPSIRSYTSEIVTPSPILRPTSPLPSPLIESSPLSSPSPSPSPSPSINHCNYKKVYIHTSAIYHPKYYKKYKFWICMKKPPPISDKLTLNYPPYYLLPTVCQDNSQCNLEIDFNDYPYYQSIQQQLNINNNLPDSKSTSSTMNFLECCFFFSKNHWIPMRRIDASKSFSLYKSTEIWKSDQDDNDNTYSSNQIFLSQENIQKNNEYWLKSNHILEPYTSILWAKLIHWLFIYIFRYQSTTNEEQLVEKDGISPLKQIIIANENIIKYKKGDEKDEIDNSMKIKNISSASININSDTLTGMSSTILKEIEIKDKTIIINNNILHESEKNIKKQIKKENEMKSSSQSTPPEYNNNSNTNDDDDNESSSSIYNIKKLEKSITIPTSLSRSSFISKPILKRALSNPAKLPTVLSINNNDDNRILKPSAFPLSNISIKEKGKYKDKWTSKKKNGLLLSRENVYSTKETTHTEAQIIITSPSSSKFALTQSSSSLPLIESSSSVSLPLSTSLSKQQMKQLYQKSIEKEGEVDEVVDEEKVKIINNKSKGKGKALLVNNNFNNELYLKKNNISYQHLDIHQRYSTLTNSEEEEEYYDYEEEMDYNDSDTNNNSVNKLDNQSSTSKLYNNMYQLEPKASGSKLSLKSSSSKYSMRYFTNLLQQRQHILASPSSHLDNSNNIQTLPQKINLSQVSHGSSYTNNTTDSSSPTSKHTSILSISTSTNRSPTQQNQQQQQQQQQQQPHHYNQYRSLIRQKIPIRSLLSRLKSNDDLHSNKSINSDETDMTENNINNINKMEISQEELTSYYVRRGVEDIGLTPPSLQHYKHKYRKNITKPKSSLSSSKTSSLQLQPSLDPLLLVNQLASNQAPSHESAFIMLSSLIPPSTPPPHVPPPPPPPPFMMKSKTISYIKNDDKNKNNKENDIIQQKHTSLPIMNDKGDDKNKKTSFLKSMNTTLTKSSSYITLNLKSIQQQQIDIKNKTEQIKKTIKKKKSKKVYPFNNNKKGRPTSLIVTTKSRSIVSFSSEPSIKYKSSESLVSSSSSLSFEEMEENINDYMNEQRESNDYPTSPLYDLEQLAPTLGITTRLIYITNEMDINVIPSTSTNMNETKSTFITNIPVVSTIPMTSTTSISSTSTSKKFSKIRKQSMLFIDKTTSAFKRLSGSSFGSGSSNSNNMNNSSNNSQYRNRNQLDNNQHDNEMNHPELNTKNINNNNKKEKRKEDDDKNWLKHNISLDHRCHVYSETWCMDSIVEQPLSLTNEFYQS